MTQKLRLRRELKNWIEPVLIIIMGNGCLVRMNVNCTDNCVNNETWYPGPAKSPTNPQVVGTYRSFPASAHCVHGHSLQPSVRARN